MGNIPRPKTVPASFLSDLLAAEIATNGNFMPSNMPSNPVYKVIFQNGNQVVEIFARQIYQSDMWGFIEVEELLFGERSNILVDPAEEKLKSEFGGVQRSYIPLHSVIRIDEVAKEGVARISEVKPGEGTNVASFPMPSAPAKPRSTDE